MVHTRWSGGPFCFSLFCVENNAAIRVTQIHAKRGGEKRNSKQEGVKEEEEEESEDYDGQINTTTHNDSDVNDELTPNTHNHTTKHTRTHIQPHNQICITK